MTHNKNSTQKEPHGVNVKQILLNISAEKIHEIMKLNIMETWLKHNLDFF